MCTKEDKIKRYRELNKTAEKHGILFAGPSLMEMFPVEKFAAEQGIKVYNRHCFLRPVRYAQDGTPLFQEEV